MSTPSMESTIETNTKIYLNYEAKAKRNDIVAYISPSDSGTFYISRMIAQPGDSLLISNGEISINGNLQKYPETIQFRYFVESDRTITDSFFREHGISEFTRLLRGYIIFATEQQASDLEKVKSIKSVTRPLLEPDYMDQRMFADFQGWNGDNMGEVYLPKAGDTISKAQLKRYSKTILDHEGVDVTNLSEYTFRSSYCFLMGDNRDNSFDSRYIGMIPMSKVQGTAIILF
jgi:signal peptidase I